MSECECLTWTSDNHSVGIGEHHEYCPEVAHLVPKLKRIQAVGVKKARINPLSYWHLEQNGELVLVGEFTEEEKAALYRAVQNA